MKVLITGGASGLGAATVTALAEQGDTPLVLDRAAPADGVDHEIVDLADSAATENAVHAIADRAGGIDAVFTAAGIDVPGKLTDIPTKEWERVVQVNLLGTAAVVRAALPYLEATHGKVVTVASTLALRSVSDATAYCASKAGVAAFTRALAAELAGRVGVTLLVPGGMATHFFDNRDEQYKPPPGAKLNKAENVAQSVLHALRQPAGCEVREMVVCHSEEGSWP
ncbi:SDR family oxidoreductase [Prauserella oleivorans]|uniref:SDR family oxidoreductase n=1 Tax=Prauserella oleivorans TaxID=1478153 RepID=A0ABW5WCX8_9PSEU